MKVYYSKTKDIHFRLNKKSRESWALISIFVYNIKSLANI